MQYTRFLLWLFLASGLAACVNPPDYPEEPIIVYEGVNKRQIFQAPTGIPDSITIQFSFTDGDGDLNGLDDSTNILLIDSRFPDRIIPFALPDIPIEGTGNGTSGDIFLRIVNQPQELCCVTERFDCIVDPSFPVDTFHYSIQVRDKSGNFSNVITTETLDLLCIRP